MIVKQKNLVLSNPETRDFLADAYFPDDKNNLPLVIFVHGYKGYKDWGAWDLMAERFAEAGFYFVKFNFSHNGTTVEDPENFGDLEAFGNNSYSKELSDLSFVIDYFSETKNVDRDRIALIGHSRGAGITIIKSCEDSRIQALITLAGVDNLDRFPKEEAFENWKKEGVYFSENGRTKQQMPHYFQFYQDFEKNIHRFDVERCMEMAKAHILIIHGTSDESVHVNNAEHLKLLNPQSEKYLIENANHVFGASEPWNYLNMPDDLQKAVEKSIWFLQEKL
ncbi:alpha/beta hydrolase [Chryseobacterium sp. Leaf180]|uniref:alpha/beta hydrolase family protein n=1 Tax=Chryseobacterium sp. Leaf180 TaxID=1736289 RepID=UPI0006FF960F|nr:prolyl oligopeptidase family serine peptidase [Chryseobacterium sp. Leaf180]KQR92628.1 alpha/beta hydrolase [Chryseobacterium sp. Leaf180]